MTALDIVCEKIPSDSNLSQLGLGVAVEVRTKGSALLPPHTIRIRLGTDHHPLPWRFADAGPRCARHYLHGAGIRKPSQTQTSKIQTTKKKEPLESGLSTNQGGAFEQR